MPDLSYFKSLPSGALARSLFSDKAKPPAERTWLDSVVDYATFSPLAALLGSDSLGEAGEKILGHVVAPLVPVSRVLDTAGATVRATLNSIKTEEADSDRIWQGIFDTKQRVSGSELLYGEDAKEKFTWSGMLAEVLLDPGTYLTAGAETVAGQTAKRAGKLAADVAAQTAYAAEKGSAGTVRRLAQSTAKLSEVEAELVNLGRNPSERLAKTFKEQFATGQRAVLQVDIPFTKIQKIITNQAQAGKAIGSLSDMVHMSLTSNPIAKEIQDRFVTKIKDPIGEALRQEMIRDTREGVHRARMTGADLMRKRLLLEAKDPNIDLKLIRVVEEAGDALDKPLVGFKRLGQVEKMIKARIAVENLYGVTDNWEEVWSFAQQVRKLNQEVLEMEQLAGVAVSEFSEFGYLARVITPEGRELLRNSAKGKQMLFKHLQKLDAGSRGVFQKARSFRELGLEDLNTSLAEMYGKDPAAFKFFDTDVVSIQVSRMLGSAKQIGHTRFARGVVDLFGTDKSAELIKQGLQVPVEKFIRPRGPLVTAVRWLLDTDPAKVVDYTVKHKVPIKGSTYNSIKLAGYEFTDDPALAEKVVESAWEFRKKKPFRAVSPAHASLDNRWAVLEKNKILTKNEVMLLRSLFAQVRGEHLKDLVAGTFTDEQLALYREILGKPYMEAMGYGGFGFNKSANYLAMPTSVEDEAPGAFLNTNIQSYAAAHQGVPGTIGFSKALPVHTFLHEYAHAFHFFYASDKIGIDALGEAIKERMQDVMRFSIGDDKDSYQELLSGLLGRTDAYARKDPAEVFANMFAQWMLGERTSNAALEKLFKGMSDEISDFRDSIWDFKTHAMRNGNTDRDIADNVSAITELFFNREITAENVDIITKLPPSARKTMLLDLLKPVYQRRALVEIAPNATEKEIREAFKAAGVTQTALPAEVVDFATRVMQHSKYHLDSDKWWARAIRHFDEIHGLYRTALTQYLPAFHARMATSNIFMNLMAGDIGVKHYHQALRMMKTIEPDEALYLGGLCVLDSGKMREVFEYLDSTRGGISAKMKEIVVKTTGTPGTKVGRAAHDLTRASANTIENISRLAHFLGKKELGMTDAEAADSVVKFLFDYSDLTDFERAVPRRLMLFYTFFRKNLPLMLEQTFKNPRFMMLYARATGKTNANIVQPDWLPDSFYMGEDEKGRQVRINFGLPPEDLARFDPKGEGLARVVQLMISSLVPVIREPFQMVSQKDLYTGRPREGTLLEKVGDFLPTSRVTGTFGRLAEAASGDNPNLSLGPEITRTLTGAGIRTIDPVIQEKMEQLNEVRDRLKALVRAGRARTIEIVGQRKGQMDQEVQDLNQLQGKILRELEKQRNK